MKRLFLLASLGIVACLGFNTATASAANCTPLTYPVWYGGGYWNWQGVLDNCSGVNAVEFRPVSTATAYLVDSRDHSVHFAISGGGYIYITAPQYRSTYQNIPWGQGCGAPHFYYYSAYQYRIRNANGNTWGAYHVVGTTWIEIC